MTSATLFRFLRAAVPVLLLAGCATAVDDPSAVWDPTGKADKGSEDGPPQSEVELKVTIDPAMIEAALEALDLDEDDSEHRYVTYYDTPELMLFEAGLVLRARKVIDDDDDSTVKFRPMLAEELWAVAPEFFDEDDFKCEIDRTPTREVSSCSLKTQQDRGEIDAVADGERDIDKLFSSEQEDFVALFGPTDFDFDDAVPLGPVDTRRWKIRPDELPARLTIELWQMPDGGELMEFSIKVEQAESEEAMEALLDFVASLGLELDPTQSTKTRRVLEYFAGVGGEEEVAAAR